MGGAGGDDSPSGVTGAHPFDQGLTPPDDKRRA